MASGQLSARSKTQLRKMYESLNVAELRRRIEQLRNRLFDLVKAKTKTVSSRGEEDEVSHSMGAIGSGNGCGGEQGVHKEAGQQRPGIFRAYWSKGFALNFTREMFQIGSKTKTLCRFGPAEGRKPISPEPVRRIGLGRSGATLTDHISLRKGKILAPFGYFFK